MNLEWYRTFKAIYEQGTLTRAAEVLFASQPGVSLHLNSLESFTGKKLFERKARRMVPTEDGKLLYAYVQEALLRLEEAEGYFKRSAQKERPTLHIGMCSEMFQLILEPEVPGLSFDLLARFDTHQNLIRDLNQGVLDLVITPMHEDMKFTPVNYSPFASERIVLVAGKLTDVQSIENALAEEGTEQLKDLLRGQIWYSAQNEMEHFRKFWFDNFRERPDFKPNFTLPNINSVIRCLSQGDGLAALPDFLVDAAVRSGALKLLWKGWQPTVNVLYFASRSDLLFKGELAAVQQFFTSKMAAYPVKRLEIGNKPG